MNEDIKKKIFMLKRELWWALHDNDMEEFDRVSKEIDILEEKLKED